MKLLADIQQKPSDWALPKEEALSIVWDAVWEEDTKYARRADTRQLSMFALDGFGYEPARDLRRREHAGWHAQGQLPPYYRTS
jgi:hypothetical protein